ncbi:MAG: hypothetical protein M3R55_14285 [Acidobacteriota bacterium]|nr:hypothetical protein [Acidobacteriota bacterium]
MILRSRKVLSVCALVCLLPVVASALGADMAMYMGGTVPGLTEKTEGKLTTSSDTALTFQSKYGAPVLIPYKSIGSLEYGQKAGRRVGVAILVSPLALFSKKRKHYLTIGYKDAKNADQAAIFELGKDIVRPTLTVLQVRTGKEIEFQDGEACKQFRTPKECDAPKK